MVESILPHSWDGAALPCHPEQGRRPSRRISHGFRLLPAAFAGHGDGPTVPVASHLVCLLRKTIYHSAFCIVSCEFWNQNSHETNPPPFTSFMVDSGRFCPSKQLKVTWNFSNFAKTDTCNSLLRIAQQRGNNRHWHRYVRSIYYK